MITAHNRLAVPTMKAKLAACDHFPVSVVAARASALAGARSAPVRSSRSSASNSGAARIGISIPPPAACIASAGGEGPISSHRAAGKIAAGTFRPKDDATAGKGDADGRAE